MENNRPIPYPSDEQKEQSIQFILNEMKKPMSQTQLFKQLWTMIGWRLITQQLIIYGISTIVLIRLIVTNAASLSESLNSNGLSILVSIPLLFASFLLLTFWRKKEAGTYELEMTTRYTSMQVMAAHLLVLVSAVLVIQTSLFACSALSFQMPNFWIVALLMNGSILILTFGHFLLTVHARFYLWRVLWWGIWLGGNGFMMRLNINEMTLHVGELIVATFLLCALYVLFYQEVMRLCMRVERGDYYAYD